MNVKTTLVIATGNAGKVKEFEKILGTDLFVFKTLSDIGFTAEIVEDGQTFAENAGIKAQAVQAFLQNQGLDWPVLSDDSGLEVEALGGAPGIYTARYAGVGATNEMNWKKLLVDLENNSHRAAQFVCVLCWKNSQEEQYFHGTCKGEILTAPRGEHGFGYDPIFQPTGYGKSFAEMEHQEKKSMSHRGYAIQELQKWLAQK